MRAKKSPYVRPATPCFVKIVEKVSIDPKHKIHEGAVFPVAQVLEDITRGASRVKIKSPTTGELIGLLVHEFAYCDSSGQFLS